MFLCLFVCLFFRSVSLCLGYSPVCHQATTLLGCTLSRYFYYQQPIHTMQLNVLITPTPYFSYYFLIYFFFVCALRIFSLGLRSQCDSNLVSAGPVVLAANNGDAESTTSGNSSASNSSASGGGHITQITSSSASAALKSSSARNSQVIVGKQQQQNNNATNSRPNSLLLGGDRTLSNKFPGFSKVHQPYFA